MMSAKEWADSDRADRPSADYPEAFRVIDALEALLSGISTPAAAAHAIAEALAPALRRDPGSLLMNEAWGQVCSATRALGADAEASARLADLLEAMQALPPLTDGAGEELRHGWGGAYWADLPAWGLTFREYGIAIDPAGDLTEGEWVAQAPALLGATVFAATLLARNPQGSGMQMYAEECLRETLDESLGAPNPGARAEVYVPAAAAWVRYAGSAIWGLCRDEGGELWGGKGFNLQRWETWKRRFGEVARDGKLSERIRGEGGEALKKMEAIEKGS